MHRQPKHSNLDSGQEAEDCSSEVSHRQQTNALAERKNLRVGEIQEIYLWFEIRWLSSSDAQLDLP